MQSSCYRQISKEPDLLLDAINLIQKEEQPWSNHFGFNAIELDPGLIQLDSALKAVNAVHPIAKLGLLMIKESTFYKWHKDTHRQCCLNMLISENHSSHTLFGEDVDFQNMNIIELKYKPKTLYLFNNQEQHCVINLDGPRYLFSLYFAEEIPYQMLEDKFSQADLLLLLRK